MTPEDIDIESDLDDLLAVDYKLTEDERCYVWEIDSMHLAGRWLNWLVKARIHELWKDHCGERKEL